MEKYTKLFARIRSRLGKNEYRYYTTLYEAATSNLDSEGKYIASNCQKNRKLY